MAMGGQSAGQIDPVHQAAAEQRAQRVGVVGQNQFDHLGLRLAHRSWLQNCFVWLHVVPFCPI